MSDFPKVCRCCRRRFETRAAWRLLKPKGTCGGLELRDCDCGSTLAVELDRITQSNQQVSVW